MRVSAGLIKIIFAILKKTSKVGGNCKKRRIESMSSKVEDAEEFELLSELMMDIDETENEEVEFEVGSKGGKDALLFQLGLADDLQLVANYGNHHLVFPVQMKMSDFSNFSMSLKSPKIFETGDNLRSWRLDGDSEMTLVNDGDEKLKYTIKDISASGISLLIDDIEDNEFPDELNNIYLQLPEREKLLLSGSQIRRVDANSVAYSLSESTGDEVLASLAEYLFERHAEKFPEAHSNQFKK